MCRRLTARKARAAKPLAKRALAKPFSLELGFYYPHFPTTGHFTKQLERNSRDRPQTSGCIVKNRKFNLVTDQLLLTPALWPKAHTTVQQDGPQAVIFTSMDGSEVLRVDVRAPTSPKLHIKPGCNKIVVDPETGRTYISIGAINGASARGDHITLLVSFYSFGQPVLQQPLALELEVQAKQTSYHLKKRNGASPPRSAMPDACLLDDDDLNSLSLADFAAMPALCSQAPTVDDEWLAAAAPSLIDDEWCSEYLANALPALEMPADDATALAALEAALFDLI